MSEAAPVLPTRPSHQDEQLKQELGKALEADRALLIASQPFTAMLAMQLNLIPVVDSRLPTAGTDGKSIFVNARFMANRSAKDRQFILAHEVWHCALGHFRRRLGRDAALWNQACDYEVNHLLSQELCYRPADALWDERFHNMSAEDIFTFIKRHRKDPSDGQQVLDTHDLASALQAEPHGAVIDPDFTPQLATTPEATQSLEDCWQQRLIAAAQQRSRMPGELPQHLKRIIDQIRSPSLPWQHLLARFLQRQQGGDRQWLPPSRRHVHRGLYLPSRRNSLLELTVAVDNSGSCFQDIPHFMAELKGMLAAFDRVNLRILVFDTLIQSDQTLTEHDLQRLDKLEITGGGGTEFAPVFAACEYAPPHALIILTDGFASAPRKAPAYPVLWALTANGRRPVPWGEQLNIKP